jgi:hypothetical protein
MRFCALRSPPESFTVTLALIKDQLLACATRQTKLLSTHSSVFKGDPLNWVYLVGESK